MTEEEVKDVTNQEPVAPDTNLEDQANEAKISNDKETNFARMREKLEKESQEKLELQRKIDELMRVKEEASKPTPQVEEEELSPDELLTVAQADKRAEKIAAKIVENMLAQKEKAKLPERTRSKFNDFDEIMTQENIKKLEKEEPGLAEACSKSSNPWEATYKILKKFYPVEKVAPAVNENEIRLQENLAKPKSSNTATNSLKRNADLWATASKDQLYKEMMEAARRI